MKLFSAQSLLLGLALITATEGRPHHHRRCSYGDPCWPSKRTWQAFNSSISGRLIRTLPSAAVCHDERYNEDLCDMVKENWGNSFWRTNQTGTYTIMAWEMGDGQCFVDSPREAPCEQGRGNCLKFFCRDGANLPDSPSLLCRSARRKGHPKSCSIRQQA